VAAWSFFSVVGERTLGAESRRRASRAPASESCGRQDYLGGRKDRTRGLARCAMAAMDIRIDDSCFDLRKHQLMRLDDARGAAIVCLQGELWLTQDGDYRDIVLAPGDRFSLDHAGVTLVTALRASSVCVEEVDGSASRA
jgi:hypothetical protein